MKRILSLVLLLILSGCVEKGIPDLTIQSISFSLSPIKVTEEVLNTKTGIVEHETTFDFIWAEKDTVGIYPNQGSQVYFAISSGAGSSTASFDGGGWEFKKSAVYYSYYPFVGDIYLDKSSIPVNFTGQRQPSKTSTDHIGVADFAYTAATSADEGSLLFNYNHLSCFVRFVLSNLPEGTYTKLILRTPSALLTKEGYYNLLSPTPTIETTLYTDEQSIDLDNFIIGDGETVTVYMALGPVDLKGKAITVSVLNSEKKEYQCEKSPSRIYEAGQLYGLGCNSWTEIPQSVGFSITNWDSGTTIGGTAE